MLVDIPSSIKFFFDSKVQSEVTGFSHCAKKNFESNSDLSKLPNSFKIVPMLKFPVFKYKATEGTVWGNSNNDLNKHEITWLWGDRDWDLKMSKIV